MSPAVLKRGACAAEGGCRDGAEAVEGGACMRRVGAQEPYPTDTRPGRWRQLQCGTSLLELAFASQTSSGPVCLVLFNGRMPTEHSHKRNCQTQ